VIASPTTLTGQALDYVTAQPVSGVDVSICRFADTACSSPIGHAQTDANGNWQIVVSQGPPTDTFAELTATATSLSIVPELKVIGYPVSRSQAPFTGTFGTNLVSTLAEYQGVLAPNKITWDSASRGWIAFVAYDCGVALAGGVKVTIEGPVDSQVRQYYVQDTSYDFSATATDATGAEPGQGGFVNVPPGQYTLTATAIAINKAYSIGHVFVVPGTRSVLYMYPTPTSP
jgi:hypothetical protein